MLFWLACEDLKRTPLPEVEVKARTIYENYISILSPKEVRIFGVAVFVVVYDVITCIIHIISDVISKFNHTVNEVRITSQFTL